MEKHSFRLPHLAFLIDGDAATRLEDVEALTPCIVGSGVGSYLSRNLLLDSHTRCVDHIDNPCHLIKVRDSNVEATELVIMPDGVWWTCNRYPR
jgi:hypothetical protein